LNFLGDIRLTAAGSTRQVQPAGDKLAPVQQLVADDMADVNRLIVARLDSRVSLIPELAGHLVNAGGKRVRPMLTLIAAQLCGYEGTRHHGLAAAVEFSGKSEATTLGIVFTVLDGVGMFGALLAGLIGEFELRYAFIMAACLALTSLSICLFLSLKPMPAPSEHSVISQVASPADP